MLEAGEGQPVGDLIIRKGRFFKIENNIFMNKRGRNDFL